MTDFSLPHVFARTVSPLNDWCRCGHSAEEPMHVAARDVPREEEIPFGYPKRCESCGRTIHRSNDHLHLNWMHGDRLGEGPIEFCGVGCLTIYAQHQTDMEALRA